jgi:hypothetical protein
LEAVVATVENSWPRHSDGHHLTVSLYSRVGIWIERSDNANSGDLEFQGLSQSDQRTLILTFMHLSQTTDRNKTTSKLQEPAD